MSDLNSEVEGLGLAMELSHKQDKETKKVIEEKEINIEEAKKKNLYEKCKAIKVSSLLKVRGKFKYLQWSDAWAGALTIDPEARFEIVKNEDGFPFFANTFGAMVFTKVTILGVTREQHLPVINDSNKAIKPEEYTYQVAKKDYGKPVYENGKPVFVDKKVSALDMMDINNAIQRCVVKNLAAFGLGLTVYRGQE